MISPLSSLVKQKLFGQFTWKNMVRSLIFIYTCFAVYVWFRADSMIFLPRQSSYQDNDQIIKLQTQGKERISARYLTHAAAKYTMLYIHGNAEDLGDLEPMIQKISTVGINIFAYDYRGYGTSEGTPTEQNAYQDAQTAYDYLTQTLKIPPQQIIIYGRSVGGGSALDLATKNKSAGLILESTFISAFRVIIPFPILPFNKFVNLDKIKDVTCPLLIIHGKKDRLINISHGETLFKAAPSPKMFWWVEEAGHNNLFSVAGDRYNRKIEEFIQFIAQKS